jgi:hypothetical protein
MANNLPAFQTELLSLFGSTTNLDAITKQRLRDRFVTAYPNHWTIFLQSNADNASNRGKFAVQMTVDYWKQIYQSESYKENIAAMPAVDQLQ